MLYLRGCQHFHRKAFVSGLYNTAVKYSFCIWAWHAKVWLGPRFLCLFVFWELEFLGLIWHREGWEGGGWNDGINCRGCLTRAGKQYKYPAPLLVSAPHLPKTFPYLSEYAHTLLLLKKKNICPLQPEPSVLQYSLLALAAALTSLEIHNIPPAKAIVWQAPRQTSSKHLCHKRPVCTSPAISPTSLAYSYHCRLIPVAFRNHPNTIRSNHTAQTRWNIPRCFQPMLNLKQHSWGKGFRATSGHWMSLCILTN